MKRNEGQQVEGSENQQREDNKMKIDEGEQVEGSGNEQVDKESSAQVQAASGKSDCTTVARNIKGAATTIYYEDYKPRNSIYTAGCNI